MSSIQVLAPDVADAIAAGEVVERPASVLKELVENSLDAGARRVAVEVQGAGRTLIRVADDGAGIPEGELRLAFQRHATSKVAALADLEVVTSLGFRGEALASIAAVSQVECRSRGRRILIRAGEVIDEGMAPPVPGTVIEVRDLFANTPARLRFLKSEPTEIGAALSAVLAYAQIYPEVRFEVSVDGRRSVVTPGDGDRRRAVAAVHGPLVVAEMIEVSTPGVSGLVSQPRLSRGNRESLLLAVNRRPIASRSLTYALEECYLGRLERGRHPLAVLDLHLDPAGLDVNVHPAKREVRFREERMVFAAVQRAVRAALDGAVAYTMPVAAMTAPAQMLAAPASAGGRLDLDQPRALEMRPPDGGLDTGRDGAPGPLRPLGQVMDGYLVAESDAGLVLVDQHAAHERILYNRYLARLREGTSPSQPLLLPDVIEVTPALAAVAADHQDRLRSAGFEVEPFGPRAVRLAATPVDMAAGRAAEALRELLELLAESGSDARSETLAASLACHSAVRFGDLLEPAEQRTLLVELEQAPDAVTCPHGRPTRLVIGWTDLRRHFRRNY